MPVACRTRREVPYGLPIGSHRESEKPRAERRAQLELHRVGQRAPDRTDADQDRRRQLAGRRGQTGSRTVGNGTRRPTASTSERRDSVGNWTPVASDSARTNDPPPPQVWVTQGDTPPESCVNGCRRYVVHWENLNIGSQQVGCSIEQLGLDRQPQLHLQLQRQRQRAAQLLCGSRRPGRLGRHPGLGRRRRHREAVLGAAFSRAHLFA